MKRAAIICPRNRHARADCAPFRLSCSPLPIYAKSGTNGPSVAHGE